MVWKKLRGLVWELRPWQWYKQGIVFLALIFSNNLFNVGKFSQAFLAALGFSLVAGANYILNDVWDREEDRNHPEKKHRPIASGEVSVKLGLMASVIFFGIGFYISWNLGLLVFSVVLLYLFQNLLYSWRLQDFVFVDILLIALGFVYRAVAGVFAIDVVLSPWIVIDILLAALLLAIGKRRSELMVSDSGSRPVLDKYSKELLDQLGLMVATSSLVAYTLYSYMGSTNYMMATLPFAYYAVFRYWFLMTNGRAENPLELFRDKGFFINFILWGFLVIGILYTDFSQIFNGVLFLFR